MKSISAWKRFVAVIICTWASAVWAQDRGTITGLVTDPTGAAVPAANVKIANERTGLNQQTLSNADGVFSVPYLPPGQYTVTAEKQGFRTGQTTNIKVEVATTTRVDMQLQVGQATETVEVTGAAPVVQSEQTS